MTTIDNEVPASLAISSRILAAIKRALRRHRERRAHRQMLIHLSHQKERMLRDMGIDPIDVAEALRGRPSPLLHPLGRDSTD